jgi:hypothetical protein
MANPHLQVHNERYKFVKFLKENYFTFAEDLWKKALGGYCLGDYHDRTVGPYICLLFWGMNFA